MSKHTSPDFDAIVDGWGSDSLDDLMARMELLLTYWAEHLPLPDAEHKIATAMRRRLCALGGIDVIEFN